MNRWIPILLLYFILSIHLIKCRPSHHHDMSSEEETRKLLSSIPSQIRHNISHYIHKYHRDPLLIETKTGQIRGFSRTIQGKEISVFYGIPFAKPPIGDLRFRRPVPIDPWDGILLADTMPNSCFQERYEYFPGFEGEEMWNPNTNISEDCLYLNIWAPKKRKDGSKVPLLVWVYGGGYMSGTISLDVYEGSILAAENDVVVAAMQYRVGAFGFLYMPGK
jgi:acetylcholinesterase